MEIEKKALRIYLLASTVPYIILGIAAVELDNPYVLLVGFPILFVINVLVGRMTIKKHPSPEMNDEMMLHIGREAATNTIQFTVTPMAFLGVILFISEEKWWSWAMPVGVTLMIVSMTILAVYSGTFMVLMRKRSME